MSDHAAESEAVEALFDAVADLPPEEADRRLAACEDTTVRDRVAGLLAHDRAIDPRFLAAIAPTALDLATDPSPPPQIPASSRLGRYYVLHKLGEGGMGAVYLGYDEVLDRRVALKVLRGELTHDWLVREGRALGRLAHPNVVGVHEVGEQDGRVFLAMELVEGPTLRDWLAEPRSFSDKLRLFLQSARGLAAAHRAGLVHRDFKPHNVLVGSDGRARVMDFGIAAVVAASDSPPAAATPADVRPSELATSLTRSGALIGTPAFMSPEQFEGKAATAASDQWAFVVALYWAAYGVSPYPDGDVRDLSKSVRTEPPAEPPRVADVPAWLWPILKRGLERDPARRFPGMDALSAEIEKHVPRDPELDPTLVVRERQILSAFFCLAYLVHSAVLLHPTLARLYMQPRPLILLPSILFGVLAVGLVARRPLLARNVYGRRLTWLFPLGLGAVIAHRAVDLHLRLAAPQILIGDGFLLALLYAIVAVGDHAWLGWVSLITVAASIASAFRLDATPTILGIGGLATIGAMCVRLFVDRNMTPGAAVGALDREPMTGGGTTTAD